VGWSFKKPEKVELLIGFARIIAQTGLCVKRIAYSVAFRTLLAESISTSRLTVF
jgi:hypothetical protein